MQDDDAESFRWKGVREGSSLGGNLMPVARWYRFYLYRVLIIKIQKIASIANL